MGLLIELKKPVDKEVSEFEKYFRSRLSSPVPLLDVILNRFSRSKGKQLRPLIIFLTARLNGSINQKTFEAAALIELLHTATLVHDDIVDEAYERRNKYSVNALWKSKKAVLIGDFLLARGMVLALENKNYEMLHLISSAVTDMSEGELLQDSIARKNTIDIPAYFEVIRKKTAVFFSASTGCGTLSVTADPSAIGRMKEFGETIGMIFQITDDIFDYQVENLSGKPSGNDLKNMKFTLPLLYAMEEAGISKKSLLLKQLFKNDNLNENNTLNSFIESNRGFEKTRATIEELRNKAETILWGFPAGDARDSLMKLTGYIIERKD